MEPIVIDGKLYFPASYVAKLWGYKESTINRYSSPSSNKIPGCTRQNGTLYVPIDSIRPITEPVAQGLLWGIVRIKNDPSFFFDLTQFNISNSQLSRVLAELSRQLYIDLDDNEDDVQKRLFSARITDKGLNLIVYRKRLRENPVQYALTVENVSLALAAIQTLLQLAQASHCI